MLFSSSYPSSIIEFNENIDYYEKIFVLSFSVFLRNQYTQNDIKQTFFLTKEFMLANNFDGYIAIFFLNQISCVIVTQLENFHVYRYVSISFMIIMIIIFIHDLFLTYKRISLRL